MSLHSLKRRVLAKLKTAHHMRRAVPLNQTSGWDEWGQRDRVYEMSGSQGAESWEESEAVESVQLPLATLPDSPLGEKDTLAVSEP